MRKIDHEADLLDRELTRLVKRYQFRDRHQVACDGITVSQCYALKEIDAAGSLVMTQLAEKLYLSLGAATRVVDQLDSGGLARRRRLPADRRCHAVELTPSGRARLRRIESRVRARESAVLRRLDPAQRRGLLEGLRRLNEVFASEDYLRHTNES